MKYWPYYLSIVLLVALAGSVNAAPSHQSPKQVKKQAYVKTLPKSHYRFVYQGNPHYYWGGRFYHHANGVYVTITAPIGAVVPSLPGGFVTIGVGSWRYYSFDGVYYRTASNGYVVIEKPVEAPPSLAVSQDSDRMIVYPASGQSTEQTGRDRYECHLWASNETGFDPTSSSSNQTLQDDYTRAISACLEARDYVVK